MNSDMTIRHGVKVDKKAREMLETKLEKLGKFSKHIVATHVIVERDGRELLLELNVTASRRIFTAKSKAFELVDAIEDAIGKMTKQLRRYEGRFKDKKKETTGR